MLRQINIKNFALIDGLELEVDPGFNVLTGETGAGKSIIIDALGLALGGRFSSEMVRAGAETAVVEAVFFCGNLPKLIDYLTAVGVTVDSDNTVIIQREVSLGGKNRCRVNGQLVTVLTLHKIGEFLVDLHGQHEHQSLLFAEKQLEMLDEYCGDTVAWREEFTGLYKKSRELREEYRALKQNEAELARKVDLLRFQINEIQQVKLVIGEDEELLRERELLSSSGRLFEAANVSYQALYNNNSGKAAVELLNEAERALTPVAEIDERLNGLLESLREAACQAEEVSRELRNYQERIQFDPERLAAVEDRLDEINKLKRKYGATIVEILQFADQCARELEELSNREERSAALETELGKICSDLGKLAERLSEKRQKAAADLERAIVSQLAELNMAKTQFKVEFSYNDDPDGILINGRMVEAFPTGADKVEFLVAPNPGEPLKPLMRIASGGELSRMMLALKTILAELDRIPTLVFDEIDVGIGGRTAQAVAEKILLIGQARQVICITHLPQIASLAKRHFYIEKQVVGERTKVTLRELMVNERIEELARMLGGARVTETTRQHAREMLTMAEKIRLHRVGRMS